MVDVGDDGHVSEIRIGWVQHGPGMVPAGGNLGSSAT
jgi:hypothetical protein